MNLEQKDRIFHFSKIHFALEYIIKTFILFLILWFIKDMLSFLVAGNMLYYKIHHFFAFPADLISSAVLMLLCLLPKLTAVRVTKTGIEIKKLLHKPTFLPLQSHQFVSYKKTRNKILKNEFLYLQVTDQDGMVSRYKLPFFSISTYTELISAIYAADTESLPVEFRSETAYEDLQSGKQELTIPKSQLQKTEWRRFSIFISIVAAAALLLFIIRPGIAEFQWYFLFILVTLMVLSIPVEVFRIFRNLKICPHQIYRHGSYLFFDEKQFSASEIERIVMTSPMAVSKTIYPLNRYIIIYNRGKKCKYWLGTAGSMPYPKYESLCREIELGFINQPTKIIYEQK